MKLIAQYKTSVRISEYEWKTITPTMIIDENTTIGEIIIWRDNKEIDITNKAEIHIIQIDEKK